MTRQIRITIFFLAALGPAAAWAADEQRADALTADLAIQLDMVLGRNFLAANRDLPAEKQHKLEPPISAAGFCRRAYLVLLGRNPTIEETREFLGLDAEPAPGVEKSEPNRLRLVRELTESSEFSRQEFRRWLARLELDPDPGSPAQTWLLAQFEARAPLDQWTSEWFGKHTVPFLAPKAPAGSEIDLAKTATWFGAFLGDELSCAACHDHPFDNVTQEQFVRLAAFLNDQGAARIPESFIYVTPNPGQPVPASTFFGKDKLRAYPDTPRFGAKIGGEPWPNIGSAQMFGDWLVKPESLAFDLNIVNRAWRRVFGVDLMTDFSALSGQREEPKGKTLTDQLVEILHAVEHDYGKLLQVLMASRITQLKSAPFEKSSTFWNDWFLTGPAARELTFDERHRSLTILETGQTGPELDGPMDSHNFRPEAAWLTSADLERRVTGNPLAAIWSDIEKADSDTEALEKVFLATLARPPGEEELTTILEFLGAETEPRRSRMARALWALLMSEEFARVP